MFIHSVNTDWAPVCQTLCSVLGMPRWMKQSLHPLRERILAIGPEDLSIGVTKRIILLLPHNCPSVLEDSYHGLFESFPLISTPCLLADSFLDTSHWAVVSCNGTPPHTAHGLIKIISDNMTLKQRLAWSCGHKLCEDLGEEPSWDKGHQKSTGTLGNIKTSGVSARGGEEGRRKGDLATLLDQSKDFGFLSKQEGSLWRFWVEECYALTQVWIDPSGKSRD